MRDMDKYRRQLYITRYRRLNKEKINKKARERRLKTKEQNKEKIRQYTKEYYRKNKESITARQSLNKERKNALAKARGIRLKAEVISAYGGTCTCCAESRFEFLTVDHIDGRKNSADGGLGGEKLYRFIKSKNFPLDWYTVLCMNCNFAKGVYGICPHKSANTSPGKGFI